ncbi:phage tail family protein [Lacticaseibacillus paracasei]|nr:phage tail family protein [Lacticaseibacillus paracasei]
MDLLVEKLDGSRYYLSQYKVLITDFEESAPSVTRNNKQLDQRNGNIDFGGWHTDKTINITGYYRADDIDEEETLREKLYALLSDPDGYYITQLKTTPSVAMERPGETSGDYYDKLSNYPSHKRFLVYTEAPEMELVGNVNGTLLYKLTVEFKTMKLPYGETLPVDISIDSPYKDVPVNLIIQSDLKPGYLSIDNGSVIDNNADFHSDNYIATNGNTVFTLSSPDYVIKCSYNHLLQMYDSNKNFMGYQPITSATQTLSKPNVAYIRLSINFVDEGGTRGNLSDWLNNHRYKLEKGSVATDWCPNPTDSEYNSWYYSLSGNVSVPYSGSVPCNQIEQGFAIEFTAKESASSLSFKIDDTELAYSGAVASGDVFMFSGFNYTQNKLSIVSKTNKAYFILQPDKPNRITCNVPGTVRIIGFQNLYA